jgi:hypothetical protein
LGWLPFFLFDRVIGAVDLTLRDGAGMLVQGFVKGSTAKLEL